MFDIRLTTLLFGWSYQGLGWPNHPISSHPKSDLEEIRSQKLTSLSRLLISGRNDTNKPKQPDEHKGIEILKSNKVVYKKACPPLPYARRSHPSQSRQSSRPLTAAASTPSLPTTSSQSHRILYTFIEPGEMAPAEVENTVPMQVPVGTNKPASTVTASVLHGPYDLRLVSCRFHDHVPLSIGLSCNPTNHRHQTCLLNHAVTSESTTSLLEEASSVIGTNSTDVSRRGRPTGATDHRGARLRRAAGAPALHWVSAARMSAATRSSPTATCVPACRCPWAVGRRASSSPSVRRSRCFAVGDRVALEIGVPCGRCSICTKGRYSLRKKMRFRSSAKSYPHFQGTLQGRLNHPAQWCHKVSVFSWFPTKTDDN